MAQRELIHDYLKSLSNYLARLNKTDANEVIKEIESHIYDAIELQQDSNEPVDVEAILAGFGEPRQLAAQYVEHILQGAPPPTGFKAIEKVKVGVTRSLYYSMALFGISISVTLIALGLIKIFLPESVGVWSAAQGNSVIVGYVDYTDNQYPNTEELLGHWFIPIAIILGMLCARLTYTVMHILRQSLQQRLPTE